MGLLTVEGARVKTTMETPEFQQRSKVFLNELIELQKRYGVTLGVKYSRIAIFNTRGNGWRPVPDDDE